MIWLAVSESNVKILGWFLCSTGMNHGWHFTMMYELMAGISGNASQWRCSLSWKTEIIKVLHRSLVLTHHDHQKEFNIDIKDAFPSILLLPFLLLLPHPHHTTNPLPIPKHLPPPSSSTILRHILPKSPPPHETP